MLLVGERRVTGKKWGVYHLVRKVKLWNGSTRASWVLVRNGDPQIPPLTQNY